MNKPDAYIFPALFDPCEEEGGYTITFPDLPGIVTEGDTMEECLAMAKEALELHLYGMEQDNDEIPAPSNPSKIAITPSAFVSLIKAWMPPFRDKMASKSINKTLTIPKWLNDLAEKEKINFSYVLQSGLKERLGVYAYQQSSKKQTAKD